MIEFDVKDTVEIEQNIDSILDFINTFAPELKKEVTDSLESPTEDNNDKALFFVSTPKDSTEDKYYIILCKIVSLEEEQGLVMFYSKNVDLLSLYMSNFTTMSYEKVKKSFFKKKSDSK